MSSWKGNEWDDGLDGVVASVEGCGGSLIIEARRLLGAIEREEISFDDAIELFVKYIHGEITEDQMYIKNDLL